MQADYWDNTVAVLYLLFWILSFVYYQKRVKCFNAVSFIFCTYILYAICSIILINSPIWDIRMHLRLFPFIYLFLMILISLAPSFRYVFSDIQHIGAPNMRLLNVISLFIVVTSLISLPQYISSFSNGIRQIVMESAGLEMYQNLSDTYDSKGVGINHFFVVISGAFSELSIAFLAFYLCQKRKHMLLIVGLTISILINILAPISAGQRGGTVQYLLTCLLVFFLFKPLWSKKIKRIVNGAMIVIIVGISIPIVALTVSRFGERAEGGSLLYTTSYLGQGNIYFNYYALDAGGTRHGDRTLNLFKQFIFSDTPKNFVERERKYQYMKMDDGVFSTFVGDFCLDFGPFFSLLIFIIFNSFILRRLRGVNKIIPFHVFLLVYLTMCINIQGGFTLFSFSDTSNLNLIAFFLIYILFKYNKGINKYAN